MRSEGPILGADTETYAGYVKLLGFGDGTTYEPKWPTPEVPEDYTDDLLDLLYAKAKESRWVVFWNLGFDFAAIVKPWVLAHADKLRETHYANIKRRQKAALLGLKMENEGLTPEEARELQAIEAALDGEETVERFDTLRYHVVLIGNKGFSLTPIKRDETGEVHRDKRQRREWFFDAAPWYSSSLGGVSLQFAATKFLGEGKSNEQEGIERARIGAEVGYYEAHREAIVRYCVQDCKLTGRLMQRTVEGFEKLGYPFPDKPFSRASVSRQYLKEKHVLDTTAKRYDLFRGNSYRDLWTKAFRGGVFLLMGAGRWHEPYAIDLNSAYPDAMVHFPSLEGAEVVDASDPRFASCFFTFYRIRLRPTPRTPTRESGETRKIYGWAKDETSLCITGLDKEILDEMGEAYTIDTACGIYTPHPEVKPLAYLAEVFGRKSEVKRQFGADSVEYANLKILLTGTYGILAQRRPKESVWTNLIYAAYVTAWCRRALWRAVRETEERGGYVVSLATDGLLIEGEKAREFWRSQDSAKLGEWSYAPHEEAICYESGVGFLSDGEGKEFTVKKRGMPNLTREALLACDDVEWGEVTQRPLKLRSALIRKRVAMLGVFEEHERNLCPVRSYVDAGMALPRELVKMPLRRYFEKNWHLRLRGQVGDRLTPPRSPSERLAWESERGRGVERGYIYYPRPSRVETAQDENSGKPASGPRPRTTPTSGAVEKHVVPSVRGGARTKGKPPDDDQAPPCLGLSEDGTPE